MKTYERRGCSDRLRRALLASAGMATIAATGACAHGTRGAAARPNGAEAPLAPSAFCSRLVRENDGTPDAAP